MNKIFKTTTVVVVSIAFLAMAALCCCVVKEAMAGLQKKSCSHCASQDQKSSSSKECCFSKIIPMEIVKNMGILNFLPLLILTVFAFLYSIPRLPSVLNTLYINGPPGPYRLVPLYIQSRSIRI